MGCKYPGETGESGDITCVSIVDNRDGLDHHRAQQISKAKIDKNLQWVQVKSPYAFPASVH